MEQTCRVCGVYVPPGFTNCDHCNEKTNKAKAKEAETLKDVSGSGKSEIASLDAKFDEESGGELSQFKASSLVDPLNLN